MSDLRTLHDAFAELERHADAADARTAPAVRPRRAVRLVPVMATVVAVAGLVASAVWLVPADSGMPTAGQPSTASSTTTARTPVPASSDELIARFRVVLGDTATFEVTTKGPFSEVPALSEHNLPPGLASAVPLTVNSNVPTDALISGTLTSAGVTGGFGLMIYSADSEPTQWCSFHREGPGLTPTRPEDCPVSTLPDGSRLATETVRPYPGTVAHMACLKRPDGTTVLLHVSNQEDPSGAAINSPGGRIYSPQSPLTLDQLKAIVTSDKW